MRTWVTIMLFISAYTPLFLIFFIRYLDFRTLYFWIGITLLTMVNLIWIPIFNMAKGWTKRTFTVKKAVNRTSDALNYIIAYIIAFLGLQFNIWQDWASLIILLVVIFFVYIHSNLIFINPLLNIVGYKIFNIETEEGGDIILITKKRTIKTHEQINVKLMSENINLEVCEC